MFLIVIFLTLPNQKFEASFGLLATPAHQALDPLSTSPIPPSCMYVYAKSLRSMDYRYIHPYSVVVHLLFPSNKFLLPFTCSP